MQDITYWKKTQGIIDESILWNIPEQKIGKITILGGNINSFVTEIRNTEFLSTLPIKTIKLLLPNALRSKLPVLESIYYADSTESGSFARSHTLETFSMDSDSLLLSGDFSKNSITEIAISDLLKKTSSTQNIIISRDTTDLICLDPQNILEHPNTIIIASLLQLQKLFRAILYPKMILLSMPLFPAIEILHKFTLSYPTALLTFHKDHIIIAKNGIVYTTPIKVTNYTPLSLWSGTLACKITALSLWNPKNHLDAIVAALFWDPRKK